MIEFEDFDDYDQGIWDRTIETNLSSILRLSLDLKDRLVDGGAIVMVSSTDGMSGAYASMAYGRVEGRPQQSDPQPRLQSRLQGHSRQRRRTGMDLHRHDE